MLRLAFDTSTRVASVALERDGLLLAESVLPVRATHSETVLPEIDRLLEASGHAMAEVEGVVVGAGPGSFTGVRIAASIAKGLCFAAERPLHAYSSLAAVAAGCGVTGPICAMFDARRGDVYAAAYREAGCEGEILAPLAHPVEEVIRALEPAARWSFAGEGATLNAAVIRAAGGRVLADHLGVPRASALLWLARARADEGRVEDPASWEPVYVRLSGAERATGLPSGAAG